MTGARWRGRALESAPLPFPCARQRWWTRLGTGTVAGTASEAVGLALLRQDLLEPCLGGSNTRLELGVRFSPELDKPCVVPRGVRVIAAFVVELAEPLEGRRQVRVIPFQGQEVRRGAVSLVRGNRGIRVSGAIVNACESGQYAGRALERNRPLQIRHGGVVIAFGERDFPLKLENRLRAWASFPLVLLQQRPGPVGFARVREESDQPVVGPLHSRDLVERVSCERGLYLSERASCVTQD
jgi:hypothetical protein